MKAAGQFAAAEQAITRIGLKTLAVQNGTGIAEPEADYSIDASDVDIDRLFDEAGRALSHGLHMNYWQAHADRDALEVKVEVIVLSRHHSAMSCAGVCCWKRIRRVVRHPQKGDRQAPGAKAHCLREIAAGYGQT
jgi:hypothetical protein